MGAKKRLKKLKKPRAFGTARRAIAKKIQEHELRMEIASKKKKKSLRLAVTRLYALDRQLALAWNRKIYCPT